MSFVKGKKGISILSSIVVVSILLGLSLGILIDGILFRPAPMESTLSSLMQNIGMNNSNSSSLSQNSQSLDSSSIDDRQIVEIGLPKPEPKPEYPKDYEGVRNTEYVKQFGYNMGFLWSEDFLNASQEPPTKAEINKTELDKLPPQPKNISEIVPVPAECEKKNWLSYPKYNVETPINYAGFKDLFNNKQNGDSNLNDPIVESPSAITRGNYLSVPIQKLLVQGIVHLAGSPFPGQVGNSYIVGHTSNFPQVRSDYNKIFKPFERKSEVGEEFYVWDYRCRKLKFRVFEVSNILAEDIDAAYKNFGDKRVVTLQGSILDANFQPTRRWLTRGELVIE